MSSTLFLLKPSPSYNLPQSEGSWSRLTPHSPPPGEWLLSLPRPIISFGYPHIIPLSLLGEGMFNLHISLLPFNRGASPNLWAWIDGTPHGVTLHRLEEGVDTGRIVAQHELHFDPSHHTLRTSYISLLVAGHQLIDRILPSLQRGTFSTSFQPEGGSYHTLSASRALLATLPLGYNTPIKDLPLHAPYSRNVGRTETRHSR